MAVLLDGTSGTRTGRWLKAMAPQSVMRYLPTVSILGVPLAFVVAREYERGKVSFYGIPEEFVRVGPVDAIAPFFAIAGALWLLFIVGHEVERVGVVAKEAPVMADSWEAGRVTEASRCATFADGLAVRVAVPLAVGILREAADRMLRVTERELAQAVGAYATEGIRVEGAAAAPRAAQPQLEPVDGPVVLVVTGRNIETPLWRRAVEHPELFPG